MSSWTMRAATEQDLSAIVDLLNEKAAQLAARGISQWAPGWMTKDRMLPMIRRGETWVGRNGAELVVTVSLSTQADPDFWTSEERKVPALYLNKLASRESGAGAMAIEWARQHAGKLSYPVLRLDAWATNEALHAYYRRNGWTHLRTMHVPGRNSGALFEIPTRRSTLIIQTNLNVHRPDSSSVTPETRPEVLLEVPGSVVKGVAPFLEKEHPISLSLGSVRPVWHDSTTWRIGIPGWGKSYADYVIQWDALDTLPTDTKYVLVAPKDSNQAVTLTPV